MLLLALAVFAAIGADAGLEAPVALASVLRQPSAVSFDTAHNAVWVSNLNGPPLLKDNNGFITEFGSDGGVLSPRWATASDKGTLHAPKGLAVIGERLYVADIDTVRVFDRKTHASVGEVKVLGASSIEGLIAHGTRLYLVDSGQHLSALGTIEPTGTDGVYVIETASAKPVLKTLVKSRALQNPKSLSLAGTTLYVAASSAPLLFSFDLSGRPMAEPIELPHLAIGGFSVVADQLVLSTNQGVLTGPVHGDTFELRSRSFGGPGLMAFDVQGQRVWLPAGALNDIILVPLPSP